MLEKSRKQANRCLHAAAECPAQLGPNTPECENEGRGECISFFFSHSCWKDQLDGVVNSELLIADCFVRSRSVQYRTIYELHDY